jgi:membrane fusion protein (multidrug efflux system)
MTASTDNTAAAPLSPPGNSRRRNALMSIAAVVVLAGGAFVAYDMLVASRHEDTDNAYVQGNVVQITPQIGGTVIAILADDTDFVKAGQPLVTLDPADARVALQQAEANLAQTVRQVRTLYANNGSLAAQVTLREADVARAQDAVARATEDLSRRQALVGNGAVSREELQHAQSQFNAARSTLAAAEAAVVAAREQLSSNQALTDGTSVQAHPSVQAAAAKLREAWLAGQRLAIAAPVDGHVVRRTVQLGQRVAAGAPLMSVVPLRQLWVDANFKEAQLRKIRIGQPVRLAADVYGSKVEFTGTVAGLGAGTGAAFALLPAQNATGNWIKVVQRVPVRIALDPAQLASHPLRVGLSMAARVDVSRQDGKMLADAPPAGQGMRMQAPDTAGSGAEAAVHRVIAANLARADKPATKAPPAARVTSAGGGR